MAVATIKVAVYRFTVWDRERGERVVATQMGTLAAIEQVNGVPERTSMLLVDESELDADGFCADKGDA